MVKFLREVAGARRSQNMPFPKSLSHHLLGMTSRQCEEVELFWGWNYINFMWESFTCGCLVKFLREVAGAQRRCALVEAHAQQLNYGDLWRFMGFMDRLRMLKKKIPINRPYLVIGVYNSLTLTSPKHNLLTTGWPFSQVKMAFNFGGTGTGAGSGGGFSFGTPSTTTAGSGTTGTTGFSFGTPAANKTPASGTGLLW